MTNKAAVLIIFQCTDCVLIPVTTMNVCSPPFQQKLNCSYFLLFISRLLCWPELIHITENLLPSHQPVFAVQVHVGSVCELVCACQVGVLIESFLRL